MSRTQSARRFCFTLNVDDYTDEVNEAFLGCNARFLIVGREVADTGQKHYQGYVEFKSAKTFSAVRKWFKKLGDNDLHLKPHIVIAKGSAEQNITYCSKEDKICIVVGVHGSKGTILSLCLSLCMHIGDYTGQGKRTDIDKMKGLIDAGCTWKEIWNDLPAMYLKYHAVIKELIQSKQIELEKIAMMDEFDASKMRPWQSKCVESLLQQDDREVLWVFDLEGNMGKTWLSKHLLCHEGAMIVRNGKCADIAYAFNFEQIIVFDFTRSIEQFINYQVIESFKDGLMFSPKYHSQTKVFKPCKVVCFANFKPDRSKLSKDRWNVITLTRNDEQKNDDGDVEMQDVQGFHDVPDDFIFPVAVPPS